MNFTKSESLPSIEQTMRTLKLSGLAKDWRSVEYRDSEQYMRELLDIEVRERDANRMARMIKQAGFRILKSLDNFAWKPSIELPVSITQEKIETASFVQEKENLVLMGAVGTGKTHLATAVALSLCEKGRHVRFFTATGLANILQEKVRQGKVRILFGSTFKMGAGTNVQDRLKAIHDADCPWRPADLEQRAGRIVRQGNKNAEVQIFRYATSGTFDVF